MLAHFEVEHPGPVAPLVSQRHIHARVGRVEEILQRDLPLACAPDTRLNYPELTF